MYMKRSTETYWNANVSKRREKNAFRGLLYVIFMDWELNTVNGNVIWTICDMAFRSRKRKVRFFPLSPHHWIGALSSSKPTPLLLTRREWIAIGACTVMEYCSYVCDPCINIFGCLKVRKMPQGTRVAYPLPCQFKIQVLLPSLYNLFLEMCVKCISASFSIQ